MDSLTLYDIKRYFGMRRIYLLKRRKLSTHPDHSPFSTLQYKVY